MRGLCMFVAAPLQTASGKTHTVEGSLSPAQMQQLARNGVEALFSPSFASASGAFPPPTSPAPPLTVGSGAIAAAGDKAGGLASQAGLIPRLVRGLFDAIALADAHTGFTMSCQLIEIYNEGLRDLLQVRVCCPRGLAGRI